MHVELFRALVEKRFQNEGVIFVTEAVVAKLQGPEWRNGRRAALKMQYRKVCGFESHLGYISTENPLMIQGVFAFKP